MTHLIDQQQLWVDIFPHSLIQGLFIHSTVEVIDQLAAGGIVGFVFALTSHKDKALREMALACTVVTDKQYRFAFLNEPKRSQIHDQLAIQFGLEVKIKVCEQLARLG